ncbi:hypothetical protein CK203_029712 [Vitis vinifera]|uniref:Uncharacterized protein n=1 Tax=Vitis vinifera TaxID=29760 RepID=A0A438IIB0_VITVI|nr:hypothetical protein CK203_029712 [Vitis vinifera]
MTPEVVIGRLMVTQPPIKGSLDCRARPFHPSFVLTQLLSDFSQSSTTPSIYCKDALLHHNIFPLQHWVQRRGVLLEALFRISEGFFFGPHHLIMAVLLYFEEKVHRRSCSEQMLFHFSSPDYYARFWSTWDTHLSLSLSVDAFAERYSLSTNGRQPEEPQPVQIPVDMRASALAVPSIEPIPEVAPFAPPATPWTPPRPMSHFAGIDHFSEHPHSADDSSSAHRAITGPSFSRADYAPEEPTTGETEASTPSIPTSAAEPSSSHHPPATI